MNIINGLLSAALLFSGGAGLSTLISSEEPPVSSKQISEQQTIDFKEMTDMMGTGNFDEMQRFMEEQDVDIKEMQELMEEGNINFGQMKPYMNKMHPNLNDQELEKMYKSMHGTGGAAQSQNFREMVGF